MEDQHIRQFIEREVGQVGSPIYGRAVEDILTALAPRRGPERVLDFMLRTGVYGDGFGANPAGLTLAQLEANPHGLDFGPHQPRIPEVLRTPSGKIELAPPALVADVARLQKGFEFENGIGSENQTEAEGQLLLIGRRDLRSNNSWMHNLKVLVKGKSRCTLRIHPDDAARLELSEGETAHLSSRAGVIEVPIEITDTIMPGVVSLPHGWGHDLPGTRLQVAAEYPGVNSNILADEYALDPLSGNAVLNGIKVSLAKVPAALLAV